LAGHPALIGRHDPYAVTKEAEARWLDHMEAALDDIHEIDSKSHLFNFFKSKLFFAHDVSKLMYVSLHHLCVCFAD
jgi:truncated hemoglobin YjbI